MGRGRRLGGPTTRLGPGWSSIGALHDQIQQHCYRFVQLLRMRNVQLRNAAPIHLVVTCRCGRRPAAWIRQTVTVFPDGPTVTLRLACLRDIPYDWVGTAIVQLDGSHQCGWPITGRLPVQRRRTTMDRWPSPSRNCRAGRRLAAVERPGRGASQRPFRRGSDAEPVAQQGKVCIAPAPLRSGCEMVNAADAARPPNTAWWTAPAARFHDRWLRSRGPPRARSQVCPAAPTHPCSCHDRGARLNAPPIRGGSKSVSRDTTFARRISIVCSSSWSFP
jgi:hypothetical protein